MLYQQKPWELFNSLISKLGIEHVAEKVTGKKESRLVRYKYGMLYGVKGTSLNDYAMKEKETRGGACRKKKCTHGEICDKRGTSMEEGASTKEYMEERDQAWKKYCGRGIL